MDRAARMRAALTQVAPGTDLREGLERILRGRTGGLIVLGNDDVVEQISGGGFRMDVANPDLESIASKVSGPESIPVKRRRQHSDALAERKIMLQCWADMLDAWVRGESAKELIADAIAALFSPQCGPKECGVASPWPAPIHHLDNPQATARDPAPAGTPPGPPAPAVKQQCCRHSQTQ